MQFISLSIIIVAVINLLFHSHLVSPSLGLRPRPHILRHRPHFLHHPHHAGRVRPNGAGHPHNDTHPGKLFGWNQPIVMPSDANYLHLLALEFLEAHNWVRKQFNQPLYTWDEKLANFARTYAMQRYNDCKMIHSNGNYGENLFWGRNLHWTPSDAVYFWYREKNWYDFRTLKCSSPGQEGCGHFTQIVWRDSVRVGCALQHCQVAGAGMLVICEYDPPGNFENDNPLAKNNAKN